MLHNEESFIIRSFGKQRISPRAIPCRFRTRNKSPDDVRLTIVSVEVLLELIRRADTLPESVPYSLTADYLDLR